MLAIVVENRKTPGFEPGVPQLIRCQLSFYVRLPEYGTLKWREL